MGSLLRFLDGIGPKMSNKPTQKRNDLVVGTVQYYKLTYFKNVFKLIWNVSWLPSIDLPKYPFLV